MRELMRLLINEKLVTSQSISLFNLVPDRKQLTSLPAYKKKKNKKKKLSK